MNRWELQTIRDFWLNAQKQYPTNTAAVFQGRSWTFRECDELVENLRSHLVRDFDVQKGDTVAMLLPNCFAYFTAYWATVKIGAIVTPVNTRLRATELEHVVANSEANVVFVHADCWAEARETLAGVPQILRFITVGFEEEESACFEKLIAANAGPVDDPAIAGEDVAILMHTSGTTGKPKGAVMRNCDLLFNVKCAIIAQSFRHEDIHLLVVPMFHATALYSMLPSCAYLGSTVVITPESNVRELAKLIAQHRVTTFFGVPTMFHFLATLKGLDEFDLSSLRLIAYAGSTMPPSTIRRLRERLPGVALHNFFGLTETISMTHVLPSEDAIERGSSIGKPLPEVWTRIIDENGNELPRGEIGELCFKRENVVQYYWNQPGLLDESITDGWFRTGDLALIDEDGYVYLKGRRKEMIIVGGENVYALEVEQVILQHEKVHEVAVVGVEATGVRTYLGELVKAVVVPKPGESLAELEIKRHCAERLASYKVPQLVEFRDELPRNPTGKVLKRDLL